MPPQPSRWRTSHVVFCAHKRALCSTFSSLSLAGGKLEIATANSHKTNRIHNVTMLTTCMRLVDGNEMWPPVGKGGPLLPTLLWHSHSFPTNMCGVVQSTAAQCFTATAAAATQYNAARFSCSPSWRWPTAAPAAKAVKKIHNQSHRCAAYCCAAFQSVHEVGVIPSLWLIK